ncbi:dsRNA-binding motif domain-containing protein [Planotetraspora mira]|uniref:DRBM domain-containing protein n=1 Tax=Planotetraspora mira TaxID=58121 RepID=A0A8J3TX19_9ACTN|nr:hypothetical protein [Planotetraspora mira]GII34390.1 hypothetical protein Pmi06nite_78320 [Planotetraspora mira]
MSLFILNTRLWDLPAPPPHLALTEQSLPHSVAEFEEVAEQLNTADRECRERKNARHKERVHGAARTAAAAGRFTDLPRAQFAPILKRAVKEDLHSDELADEITRRAAAGLLQIGELEMVLTLGSSPAWEPVRRALVHGMVDQPQHAVSILTGRSARLGLLPVKFRDEATGEAHRLVFTSRAYLPILEEKVKAAGAARRAPSKKTAQQLAVLSLLAAVCGVEDPTTDKAAPTLAPAAAQARTPTPGQHPVSALNEYASTGYVRDLRFDIKRTGPDHAPKFTAWATATIGDRGELNAKGEAGSKAGAKERAAAALLELAHTTQMETTHA